MARTANPEPTREVKIRLPAGAYALLEELSKKKHFYGSNPTEVARYLVIRELDDLTRSKVILDQ